MNKEAQTAITSALIAWKNACDVRNADALMDAARRLIKHDCTNVSAAALWLHASKVMFYEQKNDPNDRNWDVEQGWVRAENMAAIAFLKEDWGIE